MAKKIYNPSRKKKRKEKRQRRKWLKNVYEPANRKYVNSLNEMFDYAESKYGGSKEFGKYLPAMLKSMVGTDYVARPGDKTPYFTIDSSWNGKPEELFKHIDFHKIPKTSNLETIGKYVEAMSKSHIASPENYEDWVDSIDKKRYKTLAANTGLTTLSDDKYDILYKVMQSSAAWEIAKKDALDSEQTSENWQILHMYVQDAVESKSPLLSNVISMIESNLDIDDIVKYVDENIIRMLKG